MLECAFDIVTSGCSKALADTEVMVVGQKLVMELGGWEDTRFSHWDLLTGILDHVGVDENRAAVLDIVKDWNSNNRRQVVNRLQGPDWLTRRSPVWSVLLSWRVGNCLSSPVT